MIGLTHGDQSSGLGSTDQVLIADALAGFGVDFEVKVGESVESQEVLEVHEVVSVHVHHIEEELAARGELHVLHALENGFGGSVGFLFLLDFLLSLLEENQVVVIVEERAFTVAANAPEVFGGFLNGVKGRDLGFFNDGGNSFGESLGDFLETFIRQGDDLS